MTDKKKSGFAGILQDISQASWSERWRALTLWLSIGVLSILCSLTIILAFPLVYLFDKQRRFPSFCMFLWGHAVLKCNPWWEAHISGMENLRLVKNKTVVYVANHQSQADIVVVCRLGQPMRWVVKDSLFKIPFFGLGLAAAGVVFVKRHSREDASRAFRECETLVQKGNSVFFFPEGTRSLTGKMRSFKTGAFRLAKSQNVLVVPITLSGCAQLLPKGSMMPRPTAVSVTIHPPIDPQDLTLDELIDTAYKTISLPLETQGEFQQKRIHAVS